MIVEGEKMLDADGGEYEVVFVEDTLDDDPDSPEVGTYMTTVHLRPWER